MNNKKINLIFIGTSDFGVSSLISLQKDKDFNILEPGDVEEALRAASSIGDDTLQREATGRVRPDAFTHGSSEQRVEWFRRGLRSGDIRQCNTFQ